MLATGFVFTEGPVWIAERGVLLFSDIPANRLYEVTTAGAVRVIREPSGNANGCTRDGQGRLVTCEHGHRRVSRTERDGSLRTLADRFEGKRLNSPNDVVVSSDGAVYFTDPPYGIQLEEQELPVRGVYRLAPESRDLQLVADDFDRPNGLAFSPLEDRMYIDDSSESRRHVRVFDVGPEGELQNGRIFRDMNVSAKGNPDGMKVDVQGNLYCAGPGGVWVLNPDGKHLGTIVTPELPANCAWGADDLRSLYITARKSVYRIRCAIPGLPVGSCGGKPYVEEAGPSQA
jgi:gluconolactonase